MICLHTRGREGEPTVHLTDRDNYLKTGVFMDIFLAQMTLVSEIAERVENSNKTWAEEEVEEEAIPRRWEEEERNRMRERRIGRKKEKREDKKRRKKMQDGRRIRQEK